MAAALEDDEIARELLAVAEDFEHRAEERERREQRRQTLRKGQSR